MNAFASHQELHLGSILLVFMHGPKFLECFRGSLSHYFTATCMKKLMPVIRPQHTEIQAQQYPFKCPFHTQMSKRKGASEGVRCRISLLYDCMKDKKCNPRTPANHDGDVHAMQRQHVHCKE